MRWLQVCEPIDMPAARSSATWLHESGRSCSAGVDQTSDRCDMTSSSRSRKPDGDEEARRHVSCRQQRQRVVVVVGVAVVEGDRHVRTAAAPRPGDQLVQPHHLAVLLEPGQVRVEQVRRQPQIAGPRIDRVVAEHDPAPGRIGRRQHAARARLGHAREAPAGACGQGRHQPLATPPRMPTGSQRSKRTPASSESTASAAAPFARQKKYGIQSGLRRPQRVCASSPPAAASA